jgi:hypothetical protein
VLCVVAVTAAAAAAELADSIEMCRCRLAGKHLPAAVACTLPQHMLADWTPPANSRSGDAQPVASARPVAAQSHVLCLDAHLSPGICAGAPAAVSL